jgi:hypothetical protein
MQHLALAGEKYPGMKILTGYFDITGLHPVDPPLDGPRDTHFRVRLTGESAEALSETMQVETTPARCGRIPNQLERRIGSTSCLVTSGEYECFLAINISEQRVEGGWDC